MPKISIITINYNDKEGLEKTILSVLNQSFKEIEYIVIDGNSSDGSKEVIKKYEKQITYSISEPDKGIYNAMNKGIKAAKGDYLLFLNSGDDFIDDTILAKVLPYLERGKDIFYGDLIYFDKVKKRDEYWLFPNKLTLGFFLVNSLPHQASFIKRSLFESISLYNENLKIASDWEFFMIAICVHKVSYEHIGIVISRYSLDGISSNPQNYDLVMSEKQQAIDKYFSIVVDDYKIMQTIQSKRVRNLLHIKKYRWPWKLLKGFSNILLIFLPKQKEFKERDMFSDEL